MLKNGLPENPNKNIDFDMEKLRVIYLAGGCFWGTEAYMARVPGVYDTRVGYANGHTENPSYEEVCRHNTGHAETVCVRYAPEIISLENLLSYYFGIIDPTSINRQGGDVGNQYRTGIYYTDPAVLPVIESAIEKVQKGYEKRLAVEILPLYSFYTAEEYHQRYLEKNPNGYCHVSFDSLKETVKVDASAFQKMVEEELKVKLTPEQYEVTQESATEAPFTGTYWDNSLDGLYVDITSGEPLFSSRDKFESGCGWPSFTKPVDPDVITEHVDTKLAYLGCIRTETRSRVGDAHLGHVFTDGPKEKGGLRYCINSAAIRFIPYDQMDKEGYSAYKHMVR